MIERVILFKLCESSERREVVASAREVLAALPGLLSMTAGVPADEASERSWDVSVVLRFADAEGTAAALGSPVFRQFMEQTMADRYEVVKAWSFDVGD